MLKKLTRKLSRKWFQVFVGIIYAVMLLTVSGLTDLARAASTCDTSKFEGFFQSYDGKSTYAVTKNALPWSDARTLAKSADAKLATIKSEEENAGIVEHLAQYFTAAPAPSSSETKAWIGLYDPANTTVWSSEGGQATVVPSRFSWADGFSSFANWKEGQPDGYCSNAERATDPDGNCYGEPWAAITSGGKWTDEGDHGPSPLALKGVVEWQNTVLDCVKPVTPPETVRVDTLEGSWCSNSLQSSLQECNPTVDGGQLCPLERVACNADRVPPICPAGSALETGRDMCQANTIVTCGSGYTYDESIDRCVRAPLCPEGGVFSAVMDRCEKLVMNECPVGYSYDSGQDVCHKSVDCGSGAVFVASRDRCEKPPTWNCPSGYTYNSTIGKCEVSPFCPSGTTYNTARDRCEVTATVNCPAGYSYDPGTDKCVVAAACSSPSALNTARDRCEMAIGINCPTGYTYDSSADKCYQAPICVTGGSYSAANNLCTAPISGTSCPSGYTYDSVQRKCIHTPTCSGSSYNTTRDRCEVAVTKDCPSGYVLNASTQKCEQAPTCPAGTVYDATRNRCESTLSSCPAGYSWDAGLNTCVATATCSDGSVLNGTTDKCENASTITCPSGYTWNASQSKCEADPTCAAPGFYSAANNVCTAAISGTSCPTGYHFDSGLNKCIEDPLCPGSSYNSTTNRCEVAVTKDCPSGYVLNASTQKCEQAPICPAGTVYDATRNRCEATLSSCPAGYSWDAGLNACVATAACSDGSVLNGTSDKCENASTITCPAGYTWNASSSKCEATPVCAVPGTYNATNNLCQVSGTPNCPSGYSWSTTYGTCVASPVCVGGTYNASNNRCESTATYSCSDPSYTYNSGAGRCEKTPVCSQGTYSTTYDKCLLSFDKDCPAGYTYNVSRDRCEFQPPQCSQGTYNPSSNKCEWTSSYAATGSLVGGVTFNVPVHFGAYGVTGTNIAWGTYYGSNVYGYVSSAPFSGSIPVYGYNLGSGFLSTSQSACATYPLVAGNPVMGYMAGQATGIPSPMALCGNGLLSGSGLGGIWTNGTCGWAPNPPAPKGYLSITPGTFGGTTVYSCPSGGTLSGTTCTVLNQQNPTCPSGTFDGTNDLCYAPYTPACPAGMTYDSSANMCAMSAACVNGLLDSGADKCYQASSGGCSAGYSLSGSICIKTPTCTTPGVYDSAKDSCTASPASYTCASGYTWSSSLGQCTVAATCGSGGALNPTVDKCQADNTLTCLPGYTLSGSTCQKAPTCTGTGSYSATLNKCDGGSNVCGSGLTLDGTVDKCYAASTCNSGGTLNSTTDVCQFAYNETCGSGFTLDAVSHVCQKAATCDTGGTFDVSLDKCSSQANFSCPAGYGYNGTLGVCTQNAACSQGSLNTTVDKCQVANTLTCLSGYTLNGAICQKAPTCTGTGSYSATLNKCDGGSNVCGSGLTLDGTVDKCYAASTCNSGGTLNSTTDVCQFAYNETCGSGFILDSTNHVCQKTASCNTGGSLDTTLDNCTGTATFNCPSGYGYNATLDTCSQNADCPGGLLNVTIDKCQADNGYSCNSGFSQDLQNNVCHQSPVCGTGGNYNTTTNICEGAVSKVCGVAGLTVDSANNICFGAANCGEGTLNTVRDKCEASTTVNCGTWMWDSTAGSCHSAPVCANGSYNAAANECRAVITRNCGSYSWNQTDSNCVASVPCPVDINYVLKQTVGYSGELDKCVSDAYHQCSNGMTFSGPPVNKCEAIPVCNAGAYNPDQNTCMGTFTCPVGDNVCKQLVGDTTEVVPGVPAMYCSPNSCQSDTSGWVAVDDTESGVNDKKNDGEKDADGNCLGQIYLLNGNDMRCRVFDSWGMVNSYAKLVASIVLACTGIGATLAAAMAVTGSVGVAVVNAAVQLAVNAVIDTATGQPQASLLSIGTTLIAAGVGGYMSGTPNPDVGGISSTNASLMNEAASSAAQNGINVGSLLDSGSFNFINAATNTYGGAFLTQAQQVASQSTFTTFMNQVTDLASEYKDYIGVAQAGMLGNYSQTKCCYPDKLSAACKPEEIKEANQAANGMCHIVGTYCASKMLFACMVKKQTSCCFGSRLARIIHEQGRPQLVNFQNNVWGSAKSPNCRGFTPTEFQSLDFSQMDLTEFTEDIAKRMGKLSPVLDGYIQQVGQQVQSSISASPSAILGGGDL